jgi:hypothetical protein
MLTDFHNQKYLWNWIDVEVTDAWWIP